MLDKLYHFIIDDGLLGNTVIHSEFIQENISGYVRQISEDFDNIPIAQLDDILSELGAKEFERIYCVHLPNL